MGISDRDYMRNPVEPPKPGKTRAHAKKAENKPSFLKRMQFWVWNLKNRK
jgi:hypothetical protein